MNAVAKSTNSKTAGRTTAACAGAWFVAYVAARFLLETVERGTVLAAGIAILPVVPFALFMWAFIREIRAADELERRIHLEALAVAFPATLMLMMVLGLLDLAITLNPADWSYRHLWPFFVVFWLLGQSVARRRYA